MRKTKRFFILLGVGLTGMLSVGAAQESNIPPQNISDGGVEAVRLAQETSPAPIDKKFKEAHAVLRAQMRNRGWHEGWDQKRGRTIVIESADFKTTNPAADESFFIKREMAVKQAILSAKVTIIQTINQEMSAMDLVNMPGSDVNKALGAEREKLNAELARQKEIVADLLERVDKAEADILRGTTFGDRLNDLLVAAIRKLDKEYDANARDKKAQETYNAVKAEFEIAQKKYNEIKNAAEVLQEKVRERQESAVASIAKMPLYGASVIMQTESWNESSGKYQIAVMLCWSYAMERSARAIATGEKFHIKPSPNAKSVEDWLESQNLAAMVGPRQYIDKDGNRWFIGVTARPYNDELSSSERRKNKGICEMFAQQMAAFCIWADVESYKLAQQALEKRGNEKFQKDVVAESYAEKLTQSFRNKKIRGMQRLFNGETVHPITGSTIYVAVYGINTDAAKHLLEVEKVNYATKIMDNRHQTFERGRDAANNDAVRASEDRPQDFHKGYSQQSGQVNSELQNREPSSASKGATPDTRSTPTPTKQRRATSGTFSGDANVSDDF